MQSMELDKQIQIFRKKLTRVLNKVKEKMASEQANVLAVLYLISLLVSDQGGLHHVTHNSKGTVFDCAPLPPLAGFSVACSRTSDIGVGARSKREKNMKESLCAVPTI